MGFWHREVLPGVIQIEDALGVCMTLLAGSESALLVDTGYGIEDVASFVSTLTEHSVRVILTHGHHDHMLGIRWFPEADILPEDRGIAAVYTQKRRRMQALEAAREKGIRTDEEAYLAFPLPPLNPLQEGSIQLGDLCAQIIRCPGHTPGSAVVYIPEQKLLLSGDNWNPCTWLFFPEALPVHRYLQHMRRLLELPFAYVLCPHRRELYERSMLEDFINGLTDETLRRACPVENGAYPGIQTRQAEPARDQILVFDSQKQIRG